MHSMAEGFAVRRIPIGMHQGESAQALSASPGGVAERSESSKIMIAGGNHTLIQ